MKVDTKIKIFTWIYRTFTYLIPGGYVLWAFLIDTLINKETSAWDKVSCSTIFVVAVMAIIAIFFYGRHLKKKKEKITDQCIVCTGNEEKKRLVAEKSKVEAKQELFRNICFLAPFLIMWFVLCMVEKGVVSLRGTFMIICISMASGLGFNGIAQWIKTKGDKDETQGKDKE